jgi:hypothetical protein
VTTSDSVVVAVAVTSLIISDVTVVKISDIDTSVVVAVAVILM